MSWTSTCPASRRTRSTWSSKNGYLTIQAAKGLDKDQQDKDGQVHPPGALRRFLQPQLLRRARMSPAEDISAKYEDGILTSVRPQGRPEGTAQDLDHRDRINSIDRLYRRASARRLSSL